MKGHLYDSRAFHLGHVAPRSERVPVQYHFVNLRPPLPFRLYEKKVLSIVVSYKLSRYGSVRKRVCEQFGYLSHCHRCTCATFLEKILSALINSNFT